VHDISWTDRQRECIEFRGPHLLVTGSPGTGKTLVLLKRACRLSQLMPTAQVLVVTYNKALARYARDQLQLNGASPHVQAVHFHSWAWRQLRRMGRTVQVIPILERSTLIRRVVDEHRDATRSTLLGRPTDWWSDEIDWIKSSALTDWESYRDVERTGRGQGLRPEARAVVWGVFEGYQQQLANRGLVDYRDFALLLLRAWTPLPESARVSHVLVDEAQDLRKAELQVLTQLARHSLTIVADRTQKIYNTAFAWRDLGFDVRGGGRAKVLTRSYRNTRQVLLLAASLRQLDELVQAEDPDGVQGELSDREGPVPVLVSTRDDQHEADVVLRLIDYLLATQPGRTIGILARTWETLARLEPALRARRVPYEYIRDRDGAVAAPGVKLTTFHSAKGLEFDDVILVGLSEGLFPPPLGYALDATEGEREDDALSSERRLLYVAMTRTRHALYMLHGLQPSRFLAELDPLCYTRSADELVRVVQSSGS
jgi:superfamily I DNA/RNA helicase